MFGGGDGLTGNTLDLFICGFLLLGEFNQLLLLGIRQGLQSFNSAEQDVLLADKLGLEQGLILGIIRFQTTAEFINGMFDLCFQLPGEAFHLSLQLSPFFFYARDRLFTYL